MNSAQHAYISLGDGWYVQRQRDGSVMIVKKSEARIKSEDIASVLIREGAWIRLVASVTKRGKGVATVDEFQTTHQGTARLQDQSEFANPTNDVEEILLVEDVASVSTEIKEVYEDEEQNDIPE